jgi:DnaJ-domain-containing protein 1
MSQGLFEQMFAQGMMSAQTIPAHLGVWLRVFAQVGIPRIARRMVAEDPCEQVGCLTHHPAGIRCERCKHHVCLAHACLAADGRGLCFSCAEWEPTPAQNAPQDDASVLAAFAVLGLATTSSKEQVHKRARTLLGKYHPDKNPGKGASEASAQFRRVKEAHDLILAARKWNT